MNREASQFNRAASQMQQLSSLRDRVAELETTVRLMEEQRRLLNEKQRRRLLIIGGGISMLFHILLLIYLSTIYRAGAGGGSGTELNLQFAVLDDQQLTELEQANFDELETEQVTAEAVPIEAAELTAEAPAVNMTPAAAGSVPALGGSGAGTGEGLGLTGGGGAGASFFGVSSKGTRFAYIVDVSGSMGQDRKLETALRELARSVDSLPDFASFYVLLFSTDFVQPPTQRGWTRARKAAVRQFIKWLSEVDPGGGTQPRSSFLQVFSLDVRPDVIFFLTDGQIENFTPEELADLNSRGKKAVINCIAFGDPSGQDALKSIAAASGGTYRFVPSGGP